MTKWRFVLRAYILLAMFSVLVIALLSAGYAALLH